MSPHVLARVDQGPHVSSRQSAVPQEVANQLTTHHVLVRRFGVVVALERFVAGVIVVGVIQIIGLGLGSLQNLGAGNEF